MNKFTKREAMEKDKKFIQNLHKNRLCHYRLHEKRLPSSQDDPQYEPLEVHEVNIDSVYIVMLENKRVGAYYIEYVLYGKFFRLVWLASIDDDVKGVCSFVINEVKSLAKQQECQELRLSVNLSNTNAIKCYINNNFKFDEKYHNTEVEMKMKI